MTGDGPRPAASGGFLGQNPRGPGGGGAEPRRTSTTRGGSGPGREETAGGRTHPREGEKGKGRNTGRKQRGGESAPGGKRGDLGAIEKRPTRMNQTGEGKGTGEEKGVIFFNAGRRVGEPKGAA